MAFMLSGSASMLLVLVTSRILERPDLTPLFLLAWCAVCAAASAILFVPARALFARRRENFALMR
jgi:hypothetical protein